MGEPCPDAPVGCVTSGQPPPPVERRPLQVYKSNRFVGARYDWTAMQHRVVLMLIAQLDGGAEDFGEQEVPVRELLDRADLAGNSSHERIKQAAEGLLKQTIEVPDPEGDGVEVFNVMSKIRVNGGRVTARFNPDMRPLLLQLKRRYTRYVLENALRFQSPYSIRLYEMAMQYADLGHRTITVEDLRRVLVLEDKYPRFVDFRRRVLDQAVGEIGEHTDHLVSYDVIRDGRTPHAVRFYIREKKPVEARAKRVTAKRGDAGEERPERRPYQPPRRPAEGEGPEHAAFRSWWKQRTKWERAELEAAALERLDPFVRARVEESPEGVVAKTSMRAALMEVWAESTV